ncbi:nucleotidyltransferase domain-containing protein [Saccharibacillus deserti]|uniref:nucleotidyltransferase domain-containing protein n=1 Tax=Saccharibacillus deserti TaxID=1634444 RepID=UPI001551A11F|nr:nucleotidyltransferase domain-containing protein [Saccharibacillus deserti]
MDTFNVFDVSAALIERINRDYAEDVAIAAYYGSYLDGTASERSDLDFFFIPANPDGYKAGLTFILNGISFDFWPIDWERAERMSKLEDGQAGILADCKLLYVRSDEDLDRFNDLKHRLKDIRAFEGEEAFLLRADQVLSGVYPLLHELNQAGSGRPLSFYRLQAFEVMMPVFEAIALLNRTYLRKGWGRNLTQLYDLPIRPANLEAAVNTILRSPDVPEAAAALVRLVDATVVLVKERRRMLQSPPADEIGRGTGFFEEFKGLLDKLQTACERGDYELAFFTAAHAESQLNGFLVYMETGQWGTGAQGAEEGRRIAEQAKLPALMPLLDPASLIPLQSAAHWLEISLERYLRAKGVEIRKFGTVEEFRGYLLGPEA